MPTTSWKSWERRVAKIFGVTRRGPIFRSADGGTDDCTSERYSIECKLLARPTYGQMLDACKQAEAAQDIPIPLRDDDGVVLRIDWRARQPLAIVKRLRDRDGDALVCMRLETWLKWQGKGCETVEEP
jgi:hypothetical protein